MIKNLVLTLKVFRISQIKDCFLIKYNAHTRPHHSVKLLGRWRVKWAFSRKLWLFLIGGFLSNLAKQAATLLLLLPFFLPLRLWRCSGPCICFGSVGKCWHGGSEWKLFLAAERTEDFWKVVWGLHHHFLPTPVPLSAAAISWAGSDLLLLSLPVTAASLQTPSHVTDLPKLLPSPTQSFAPSSPLWRL